MSGSVVLIQWGALLMSVICVDIQGHADIYVEGHLGCFQVLGITNNAAMNIVEQMSLLYECAFFVYKPKRRIAGSCGKPIAVFLRNSHTDFQNG
ncbi:zinc finger protein [Cricetulus griseus]|nr:zinc finger protein [Cricetulus griseus]